MPKELTEIQKKQIVAGVKVGGALVIGLIVAPMVYIAIQGLLGLCLAAVVVLVAINGYPVLVDACSNIKLKGIKWIAAKNPVETLQKDYIDKRSKLAQFLESIRTFTSSIMTFEGKYKKFIAEYPEEKERFDEILSSMKKLLKVRTEKYREAEKSLDRYEAEIQKASAIWEMSVEASKMNKAAGLDEDDVLAKIKTQTSLDAIEHQLNESFADLQTSLIEQDDERKVSKVIDVPAETR